MTSPADRSGDGLKKQIEAGKYPGIVKTTLDGVDQRAYLEGTSDKSARDYFFYFSGATPSAVRYKNWKMYYTMSHRGRPAGSCRSFRSTSRWSRTSSAIPSSSGRLSTRSRRWSLGGALASPMTAFLYDWNMLPIGQQLWLKHLESYIAFPPLQEAATYNLTQVIEQVKKAAILVTRAE